MEDPHPDFRVLESERQRRRGRSEEDQCCWREGERACVVALSSPSTVLRCLPVFSAPIPALHMRDAEGNIPKKEGSLFAAVTARSYRVCFLFGGRDWLLEDQTKPELPEMI